MSGEKDLDALLTSLSCTLHESTFVFATFSDNNVPDGLNEVMRFRETEGTTLILTEEVAKARSIPFEFRCRMITLNVHSSLEAVGFIAKVATALAAAGMGVNPVSGFFHDHLFVPARRAEDALAVIDNLRSGASS